MGRKNECEKQRVSWGILLDVWVGWIVDEERNAEKQKT